MWTIFAVALLAALRRSLGLRPRAWRIAHTGLAIVIVAATVVRAIPMGGAMETVSKPALFRPVLAATIKVMADLRVWRKQTTFAARASRGNERGMLTCRQPVGRISRPHPL
jgi:hypothetical protein